MVEGILKLFYQFLGAAAEGRGPERGTESARKEVAVTDHEVATGKESTEREVENEIAIMRPSPVPHHLGLTEIETEKETGTGNVNTAVVDINFAFYLVRTK